jgi:hypothetical protein
MVAPLLEPLILSRFSLGLRKLPPMLTLLSKEAPVCFWGAAPGYLSALEQALPNCRIIGNSSNVRSRACASLV